MTPESLQFAVRAAEKFLDRARAAEQTVKKSDGPFPYEYFDGNIQTGAVKRASMDLTRALAAMRKPG